MGINESENSFSGMGGREKGADIIGVGKGRKGGLYGGGHRRSPVPALLYWSRAMFCVRKGTEVPWPKGKKGKEPTQKGPRAGKQELPVAYA